MHEVGRGVCARDSPPTLTVHLTHNLIAGHDLARGHGCAVNEETGHRSLHVVHLEHGSAGSGDAAVVAELAARLGVEGCAIEHDLDVIALTRDRHDGTVSQDAGDDTLRRRLDVAREAGGAASLEDLAVGRHGCDARLARSRISLGALALLAHESTETILIHIQTLLAGHLESEVEGESVGVVEREGLVAREEGATVAAHLRGRHVKNLRPRLERLEECPLLLHGNGADAARLVIELGVLRGHRRDGRRHELADRWVLAAEDAHVADDPAHETSQDVAASLIAGNNTVTDEEGTGARVIGDDAQGDVGLLA